MAQPSHRMEVKRWSRHSRKPSASASQLSPASPQPRFTRGETASGQTGGTKGLSCLTRKFHEQFLGEGTPVMVFSYPTPMCVTPVRPVQPKLVKQRGDGWQGEEP